MALIVLIYVSFKMQISHYCFLEADMESACYFQNIQKAVANHFPDFQNSPPDLQSQGGVKLRFIEVEQQSLLNLDILSYTHQLVVCKIL